MRDNKEIYFTTHALQRCSQRGLDPTEMREAFSMAKKIKGDNMYKHNRVIFIAVMEKKRWVVLTCYERYPQSRAEQQVFWKEALHGSIPD